MARKTRKQKSLEELVEAIDRGGAGALLFVALALFAKEKGGDAGFDRFLEKWSGFTARTRRDSFRVVEGGQP